MKAWFSVHGIPKVLESDNGPHYSSKVFDDFSKQWNFQHKTSSPKFPQSNGLAERFVQTAKNMLRKCSMDETDFNSAMLNYRNTPRSESLGSPAQRLMNRRLRSSFPTHDKKLEPKVVRNVEHQLKEIRGRQKFYFDKSTKTAPTVEIGDDVRLKLGHRNWTGAKIVSHTDKPRSVLVETKVRIYRRNTSFIRPTKAIINEPVVLTPNVSNEALDSRNEIPNQSSDEPQSNETINNNPVVGGQGAYVTRFGREVRPLVRLNL